MAALSSAAGGESTFAAYLSTPRNGPQSAGFVAGPQDAITAHFCWCDPIDQTVANTRSAPWQILAYLVPQAGNWNLVYTANGFLYLRKGFPATVLTRGNLRVRFPSGAVAGQSVYASLLDGTQISGYSANAELTPWFVVSNCAPWGYALISTWSTFT